MRGCRDKQLRADTEMINGANFPVKRMKREICGKRKSIKMKKTHKISGERISLLGCIICNNGKHTVVKKDEEVRNQE